MKTKPIYTLFIFLMLSCTKNGVLNKQEFEAWMKSHKNGMVKEKVINRLKYKVSFQPLEWLRMKAGNLTASNSENTEALQDYANVMTFTMDITDTSGNYSMLRYELANEQEYYDRIHYYGNLIEHDLKLVDGSDTLECQFTHMENTYNISPINTITIEFVRINNHGDYNDTWLIYNDRVFNSGILKFHFKKEDLNTIPELKL